MGYIHTKNYLLLIRNSNLTGYPVFSFAELGSPTGHTGTGAGKALLRALSPSSHSGPQFLHSWRDSDGSP